MNLYYRTDMFYGGFNVEPLILDNDDDNFSYGDIDYIQEFRHSKYH